MTTPIHTDASKTKQSAGRTRLGAALLAIGTVQFFVMHVIVQSAWTEPPYSWWTNYISDLGAVHCAPVLGNDVCSPLHAGMNTAFIIQGVLLLLGTVLTAAAWSSDGRRRVWQVMVGVAGISWMIVGLIPEDVNLTGHSIGALPIFIIGIHVGSLGATVDPGVKEALPSPGPFKCAGYEFVQHHECKRCGQHRCTSQLSAFGTTTSNATRDPNHRPPSPKPHDSNALSPRPSQELVRHCTREREQ